jgi:hypothetical protein
MMNEESTAINSPHNNAGRRKGAITEIDQVAGVVKSSLHENEINNINKPHNKIMQGEGKETKQ